MEGAFFMQCSNPVLIRNAKPTFGDSKSFGLWVPCGKCVLCRIARAREWSTRMLHELNYHDSSSFLTLTYDDDHLPFANLERFADFINCKNPVIRREVFARHSTLVKEDLQLFFKRMRKLKPFRYYACGEYGETNGRAHYHVIAFGLGLDDEPLIASAWTSGEVHCGSVTYDSCRYVADYVGKSYSGSFAIEVYGDREIPFQLCSTRPGIGFQWSQDNADYLKNKLGCTVHGAEVGLPRYYRKKLNISTEQMAEKALERDQAVNEHYEEKGYIGEAEQARPLKNARIQAGKNAKARQNLFKRDKF